MGSSGYKESVTIAKNKIPAIIIAANGMCEVGRIMNHLKFGISNPKNTILIVSYMGEGTLGRKILEKEPAIRIDSKEYQVLAETHKINAFSAHANYDEILDWLKAVDTSRLKKIYLVHGDTEALTQLSEHLKGAGFESEIVQPFQDYALN